MSNPPIATPAAPAASTAGKERAPQLLALVLALGVGTACGWRARGLLPGVITTGSLWLGFWLGRQLGKVWLGVAVAAVMGLGFLAEVNLAWEGALLLALIGTVAIFRWRNDPAPALALVALAAWAGFAWLLSRH